MIDHADTTALLAEVRKLMAENLRREREGNRHEGEMRWLPMAWALVVFFAVINMVVSVANLIVILVKLR
jgi:hypothetical protein